MTVLVGDKGVFVFSDRPYEGHPAIWTRYFIVEDCPDVRFVQTVKLTIGGQVVTSFAGLQNGKNLTHVDDDITPTGTFVDHIQCEKDQYYNGHGDPQDWGQAGRKGVPDKKDRGSYTFDAPSLPDSDLPDPPGFGEFEFELCAVCVDTGAVLDCVKWSYKRTKNGVGEISQPTQVGPPSPEFGPALDLFTRNHTAAGSEGGRICPDASPVQDELEDKQ